MASRLVEAKTYRVVTLVVALHVMAAFEMGDGLDDRAAAERISTRFFSAGWGYGTARVLAERPDVVVLREPADLLPQLQSDRVIG